MTTTTQQLWAAGICAVAASISVAAPCSPTGSRQPQRVHLKALLLELAAQRDFKLEYWTSANPEVVFSGGDDVTLMTALAEQANLIVRYAPAAPRCPAPWKIDTVWVLPVGQPAPRQAPPAQPPQPLDAATLGYLHAHGAAARPTAASAPVP